MARPALDLSLYLVTDTGLCGARGVEPTVARAVAAGVTAVQLRDTGCSDEEFVALGHALRRRLDGTGVPLILNDRVHLFQAVGADGVHVGQKDTDVWTAREQIGRAAYLGLSVQTVDHLGPVLAQPRDSVDYLGVGPIWTQSTKHDAADPSDPDTLAAIVAASPWPCVAIGGVDATNAAVVRRTGARGIAVVSAICGQPDITTATRELRQAWEQAA